MGDEGSFLNTYEARLEKKSGFESEVKIRDHIITIDEPESLGGTDKGPNPVEVLLCSIVSCLDFTGTIVAKDMGHELKNFTLEVEGKMDPRGVMAKADVPIGFQTIKVKVKEIKGIPEDEIPEFLESIQDRCPVHNTLKEGMEVEVER